MRRLVLATRNAGKVREIRAVLDGTGLEVLDTSGWPDLGELPEPGATYAENAYAKALAVHRHTALPALADDSGLEVDALGGEPGPFAARFGGPGLSDAARNALLLERLDGVPRERRTARFRAVLALVWGPGPADVAFFEGVCEGWVGQEPRGEGGFGYDPVFYLRGEDGALLDRSLAELAPEEKNAVSHRGRALALLRRALVEDGVVRRARIGGR